MTIFQKINFLYPKRGDEFYQKLRKIIDDFKKKHKSNLIVKSFSEKDIVLICYPDHIKKGNNHLDNGRPQVGTLEILHQFLKKYAKGLVNKIHLLPFYPYSSDEGFSVIDFYQVRKDLGDWEDIKALSYDFDLIFDFVLNHISSKSDWFQRFLAGDKKFAEYFLSFDKKIDISSVYRPRAYPLLTPFKITEAVAGGLSQQSTKYVWTTFSSDQIDLNYQNPKVFLKMVKVLLFYVSHGASAIRLDAVRYLWKNFGTTCVDLPQTHIIIKILREILNEVAPNVLLLSEVKASFDAAYSYFGEGDESDLIYNFELPPLILASFLKEDVSLLSSFLKKIKKPPTPKNAYFNITATHDGIGLTPLVGLIDEKEINWLVEKIKNRGGLINYHLVGRRLKPYELDITYLDALGGVKPFLASQAIQLSLAGVPGIYFGSFIGGQNWIEGVKKTGEDRAINRERFNYQKLIEELEDENSIKHQVYFQYKKLLQARINESLFSPLAEQQIIDLHPKIFSVLRSKKKDKLLVLVNVSNKDLEIKVKLLIKILEREKVKDLISGQKIDLKNRNYLLLKGYQTLWLKL